MNWQSNTDSDVAALIIGFTIQGLALSRALDRNGVPVYAIVRRDAGHQVSSVHASQRTERVKFLFAEDLLGQALIQSLLDCRPMIPAHRVVLYPASDNTVSALAKYWDRLKDLYILSWSDCREDVLRIIHKGNLPEFCNRAAVYYPRTALIRSQQDCQSVVSALAFPLLVKPDKPASSFKTHVCNSAIELNEFVASEKKNWPLVVQEWIEGPDWNLYFYSCFLARGEDLFGMTGRKLRASPPGLGRATVMESFDDAGVREASSRLIRQWAISGPVSLEFKKDNEGKYWFIEANVGRTEYCIDLVIQCGFNVPLLEFNFALERSLPELPSKVDGRIWYDTDKEPFCYLSQAIRHRTIHPFGKRSIFPYLGHGEWKLVMFGFITMSQVIAARGFQKCKAILNRVLRQDRYKRIRV